MRGVEMLAQKLGGHEFEENGAKHGGPALVEALPRPGRKDAGKGVKEGVLSGVDGMAHA
jgi:hypothetical protein